MTGYERGRKWIFFPHEKQVRSFKVLGIQIPCKYGQDRLGMNRITVYQSFFFLRKYECFEKKYECLEDTE